MRKPELLVPASSLEVLKVAVIFGADAVYIGGEVFGLRAKAKNFSMEDMKEGVEFAHEHGVKVYVTANILAHNQDLEGVRAYFAELKEIGPDALIISDPGVYRIAMEVCPEIERHTSTQANNTNYGTYQFWWKQGAKRVVTARELSLNEISAGAVAGGDQRDSGVYSGGDGDRDVYSWGDVYFVLGEMSAVQLFHGKRCEPGGLYTSVPVEVCGRGRVQTGGVFAGV